MAEGYAKRAEMEGWDEERYMAYLEKGRCAVLLGHAEDVVLRDYLAAYETRPTRCEPLHDLARYYREKKQYGKSYIFAKAGVGITRPKDSLFLSQEVYDWRMLDELGVCAYWVGDYAAGKSACEEILRRVEAGLHVPEVELTRIKANLDFSEGKLKKS